MQSQDFETHVMLSPWLVSKPTMALKSTVKMRKGQDSVESQTRTELPNYEIQSNDKESRVQVDLPGVIKKDVDIKVVDCRLEIRAKRMRTAILEPVESVEAVSHDVNVDGFMQDASSAPSNTPFCVYSLNVQLGDQTDCKKIVAESFKNGVVTIRVPKYAKPPTMKISIT